MTRLLRALARSAQEHDASVMLAPVSEMSWESATFSGFRHTIAVTATASPAFDAWLQALCEIDLSIPGQIVADLIVGERSGETMTIEVLTIFE